MGKLTEAQREALEFLSKVHKVQWESFTSCSIRSTTIYTLAKKGLVERDWEEFRITDLGRAALKEDK